MLIMICSFQGGLFAQDSPQEDLCAIDLADSQKEIELSTTIGEALSKEAETVRLSTIGSVPLENNDIGEAKDRATFGAFRSLLQLSAKQMVSPFDEALFEEKILKVSRLFIRTYHRTGEAKVCGEEYRLPVTVELKLKALRQALIKYKMIDITFGAKVVTIQGIQSAKQVESFKQLLRSRIRNVKRVVEKYQKRGMLQFMVETSSSAQDIAERLRDQSGQGDFPLFKIQVLESGGIEIALLKS